MTENHATSLDELYAAYGALILRATGRQWWQKAGIQSRPKLPYATVFFTMVDGNEQQVVSNIELNPEGPNGEIIQQIPWGTAQIETQIEFYGSRENDTAQQAASRMRASLYLEKRWGDIYLISALSGKVSIQDLSLIFREDVEPRTLVRFMILANIVEPVPLADTLIYDIHSQKIEVIHVREDELQTTIEVDTHDDSSI
jgi:hypothetical protein